MPHDGRMVVATLKKEKKKEKTLPVRVRPRASAATTPGTILAAAEGSFSESVAPVSPVRPCA